MGRLDASTVFSAYTLTSALCGIVLTIIWAQYRERYPELGFWMADYLLQPIALVLVGLRGRVPDLLSVVIANLMILGGTVLLYEGLMRFFRWRGRQVHNIVMLLVLLVAQSYFTFVRPDLNLRNVIFSAALLFITTQLAWVCVVHSDPELRQPALGIAAVFVAFAGLSAVRCAADALGGGAQDLFQMNGIDTLALLGYQMLFVALAFALYGLVNRRLFLSYEHAVNEAHAAEKALLSSERKFSVAFHSTPYAMLITRLSDGRISDCNDRAVEMYGWSREEMTGHTTIELGAWVDPKRRVEYTEALLRDGAVVDFEATQLRKGGQRFITALSGGLFDSDGEKYILVISRDVTSNKLAEEELQYLSERDPLTSLLNQRAFYERAQRRLDNLGDAHASLVYLDLNRMKAINDRFGHLEGDRALQAFADALKRGFRDSDVIARLRGDEFVVLAVSRTAVTEDAIVARFLAALQEANESGRLAATLSASYGIASVLGRGESTDLQAMISRADARMYEAKRHRPEAEARETR